MKFVHIKEKDIVKDELLLIGLGDVHLGSTDCNVEKFKRTVDWIKSKPNSRVIIMGDLIDAGLKDSIGGGTFDNDSTPEQQMTTIIDLLKPIKEKIWCILSGNHEDRVRQRTSIDVTNLIASALDAKYCGSSCFIKVMFGKQNYIIFAAHGNTGSLTPSGKLGAVMKFGAYIDADLYMMGHVHELMHHTTDYLHVSLKDKMILTDKRHYVLTGHFLNYGGYAEQKGYAPGKTGVAKIILRKDKKKITVSI